MTILMETDQQRENGSWRKLNSYRALEERWETYVREKSSLETKIGLLDRLTEFFRPNGAMMGQAIGRMGSFTEDLNQHLAAFGYTCNLALEPFEIRVSSTMDNLSACL